MKTPAKKELDDTILLGTFSRRYDAANDKWKIRPNFGRIAVFAAVAAVLLWLCASAAVFCGLKYLRKYDTISCWAVLQNPFSTGKFRVEMGEVQIARARECLKKGDYQGAFFNLAHGSARSPDNLEARMLLAQMYMTALRNPKRASEVLEARIPKAFAEKNADYLSLSIICFSADETYREKAAKLLAMCADKHAMAQKNIEALLVSALTKLRREKQYAQMEKFCAQICGFAENRELKTIAAKNRALVLSYMSESEKAEKILEDAGVTSGETAVIVKITRLFESGREIEAAAYIKAALVKIKNKTQFYGLLSRLADDFGDTERAAEAKKLSDIVSGNVPAPALEKISNAGGADVLAETKKFAQTHPDKLDMLASAAILSRDLNSINFCLKTRVSQYSQFALFLAKAELLLYKKDAREASTALDAARYGEYAKHAKEPESFESFEIAVSALSGNDVSERLELFARKRPPFETVALAKMLARAGLSKDCEHLLKTALEIRPHDVLASAQYCDIAYKNRDIAAIIEQWRKNKIRIPVKILAKLKPDLQSDRLMFENPDTIAELSRQSDAAKEKIAQYKKLFGNF